jgi:hypothetical protein
MTSTCPKRISKIAVVFLLIVFPLYKSEAKDPSNSSTGNKQLIALENSYPKINKSTILPARQCKLIYDNLIYSSSYYFSQNPSNMGINLGREDFIPTHRIADQVAKSAVINLPLGSKVLIPAGEYVQFPMKFFNELVMLERQPYEFKNGWFIAIQGFRAYDFDSHEVKYTVCAFTKKCAGIVAAPMTGQALSLGQPSVSDKKYRMATVVGNPDPKIYYILLRKNPQVCRQLYPGNPFAKNCTEESVGPEAYIINVTAGGRQPAVSNPDPDEGLETNSAGFDKK